MFVDIGTKIFNQKGIYFFRLSRHFIVELIYSIKYQRFRINQSHFPFSIISFIVCQSSFNFKILKLTEYHSNYSYRGHFISIRVYKIRVTFNLAV